ncbi:MAG: AAA family ATPase [Planctomycetes bacterium]|nr:AAA family ATPase [Planctomycetota bacterium]
MEVYAADTRSRIENIRRESSIRSRLTEVAALEPHATRQAVPASASATAPGPRGEGRPARGEVPSTTPEAPAASVVSTSSAPAAPPAGASAASAGAPGDLQAFSQAVGQARRGLREVLACPDEPPRAAQPFLRECYETLVSREVELRVAELIVEEISRLRVPSGHPDPMRVREVLRRQLTKLFLPNPPLDDRRRPRIIVLVGPTGVGKTTTIAKLAARAKLNERRRVGLITLDTFRIAAVDQLEKYAEIIGVPLIVATSPPELAAAVEELRAKQADVVFVDSAGRSHRDELKMTELREFLQVAPEAEVHLVLSTTTHGKTILSVANRFAGIGFHRVILTKVDETISFGALVSALISIGRPISFVTDGQNVPDDIVASDPERLADLVLKTNAL